MRDSEKHETQYGYYTIGEYDAREETDDLGRKNYEYEKQQRLRDNIKNGLFSFASDIWYRHPGCAAGTLLGIFLGLCILIFGFFSVLFVVICGAIGLFIGFNVDKEGNWWHNIQRSLPDDWHRWK